MTTSAFEFTTTGRRGVSRELGLLVDAARRGDVQVRQETRWPVFLINGQVRPEVRPALSRLLADGVLVIPDPDAAVSLIVPAVAR